MSKAAESLAKAFHVQLVARNPAAKEDDVLAQVSIMSKSSTKSAVEIVNLTQDCLFLPTKIMSGLKQLHRQESIEGTPSPQMGSSPTLPPIMRHSHSLKYSGGALHGNDSPQIFDHTYNLENHGPQLLSTTSLAAGSVYPFSRQLFDIFLGK